jgi:hypothetical protein
MLVAVMHILVQNRLGKQPALVLNKFEELVQDKSLMDSIGGWTGYEIKYNTYNFKFDDTVKYTIAIKGRRGKKLMYQAVQLRGDSATWVLLNETLTIN